MTQMYDQNVLGSFRDVALLRLLKRMMLRVKETFFSVFHTVELTFEST